MGDRKQPTPPPTNQVKPEPPPAPPRRCGISKIVSLRQEQLAGFDLVALTFAEAYAELRRASPTGDLHIHLHIDSEDTESGGDDICRCNERLPHAPDSRCKLSRHERHQLAADHGVDTWEDYRGER